MNKNLMRLGELLIQLAQFKDDNSPEVCSAYGSAMTALRSINSGFPLSGDSRIADLEEAIEGVRASNGWRHWHVYSNASGFPVFSLKDEPYRIELTKIGEFHGTKLKALDFHFRQTHNWGQFSEPNVENTKDKNWYVWGLGWLEPGTEITRVELTESPYKPSGWAPGFRLVGEFTTNENTLLSPYYIANAAFFDWKDGKRYVSENLP